MSAMKLGDYRLGLSLLSREDLEEACIENARKREALQGRMVYWKHRCELAEDQIARERADEAR